MKQKGKDKSTKDLINDFIEEKEKSKRALLKALKEINKDTAIEPESNKKK